MSNSNFEARVNSGALFANVQKQDGSRQPDYRGYLLVGEVRVQLAGWKRTSKSGGSYVSIQVDDAAENTSGDGTETASA